MSSSKASSFSKYRGECSRCKESSTLKTGVFIKHLKKRVYGEDELHAAYEDFEEKRSEQFKKFGALKKDPLLPFIMNRTDMCPHKMLTPLSVYWYQLISTLDGEMGLSLPKPDIEQIPALFFDALNVVRNARSQALEEERGSKNHSNQDNPGKHGGNP